MHNPIIGTQLISRKEFENILLNRFGLKLDIDSIYLYVDGFSSNTHAYNIESPLVFTISFVDHLNASWANIYGVFYNEHTKNKTQLFIDFKDFISSYTFKYKNHFLI